MPAENGADAGAAIFSLYGRLSVEYSTISGNHSTGSRAGIEVSQAPLFVGNIAVYPATTFTIYNSIVANNGAQECSVEGPSIVLDGFGNLIVNNSGCPGVVSSSDPLLLGLLQVNQSFMPLLAIGTKSPAWNSAIPATFLPSDDQRGQTRPQMGGYDIGAFELCVDRFLNPCQLPPLTAIPNTLKNRGQSSGGRHYDAYRGKHGRISKCGANPDSNAQRRFLFSELDRKRCGPNQSGHRNRYDPGSGRYCELHSLHLRRQREHFCLRQAARSRPQSSDQALCANRHRHKYLDAHHHRSDLISSRQFERQCNAL